MKSLEKVENRLQEILDELEGIQSLGEEQELDKTQVEHCNSLYEEFENLQKDQKSLREIQARTAKLLESRLPADSPMVEPSTVESKSEIKDMIPARAKACNSKHFATSEDAYTSGMFLAHLAGNKKATEFLAVQSIGTDDEGGYAVPAPLSSSLINLLEEYGVARQQSRRIIMSSSTWAVPKVTAHATVYYPAEAAAITASDVTFGQVTLTAKKVAALIKMSTEVTEDAVVSMMDLAIQDIAYQIAVAEDTNLFLGVASAINANGIEGDTSVADTNVASVAAMDLADFSACAVSVGSPIVGARNEWYMHPTVFHGPVRDLLDAAGGNTMREFEGGQRPMLHGYPVNFVNVMPDNTASTSGDMLAAFGDLSLGVYFGDRRSLGFQVLNELYKVNDQVGVIATERIDISVANPEVLGKITIT